MELRRWDSPGKHSAVASPKFDARTATARYDVEVLSSTRLEGKFKLGQNRSVADQRGVRQAPAKWFTRVLKGKTSRHLKADGTPFAMPAFEGALVREQIWLAITYLVSADADFPAAKVVPRS